MNREFRSLEEFLLELDKPKPKIVKLWLDIYYKIWHVITWCKDFPKEVKYFIQRGRRGWSDRDAWDIDHYLSYVIPDMITHLRLHTHSYPTNSTPEKWNDILNEIVAGFTLWKKREDDNIYSPEVYLSTHHKIQESLNLMGKWWPNLWD